MATTYFIDNSTPIVSAWLNDVNTAVYSKVRSAVAATSGQTVFTVPFDYQVGSNYLSVYINGVRQILNSSYTETNSTTVTFSEAVPVTAIVEFVLG
ncbi:hypothetical protein UFOVP252_65 [uncultured Caudovirales phage]|uniref:DUF4183 domain-containing protein n=1 Tax=uncultured Caudovirales phage TaxID=2100421 RepID=A0A6J5LF18_9CAUD|nr:hypothetical protein UFOVP252_65 [uncultured Caudovirales phage]